MHGELGMMEAKDLLTAGKIAKELGLSEAKVKKAIKDLNLNPAAKKGVCSYYTQADKTAIQKKLNA
jgi:hypothetical protein